MEEGDSRPPPEAAAGVGAAIAPLVEAASSPRGLERALERLVTHRAIWPIVLELTGGRPHFSSGTLQVDRHDIYAAGLSLHCGREDSKSFAYEIGATSDNEMRCNDFVFFPYLDDVGPADGGLVVLPGSREGTPPRSCLRARTVS